MAKEELPDWLKPSTPDDVLVEEPLQPDEPEWLQPTTVAEVPPPETPVIPQDEPDDSYWNDYTRWAKPIVQPTVRAGVRAAEDIYNASQEFLFFGEKSKWEDEWLGKPESAVEDIAAEMGSWVVGFVGPGGVVQKGVSAIANIPKISSKASKLLSFIGKTRKGEKTLQVGKIAAEGALKGAVADYLATDVGDVAADEAIQQRLRNTVEGAGIGAAVNLTTFGAGRLATAQFRRLKALRKVKQAAEGKGDATQALKELKASIDEETAIKEDFLSDIKPTDDRVDPTQSVDDVIKEAEPPKVEKPEVTPKVEEPAKPAVDPEIEIEDYIQKGKSLPEQVNRLVRLNVALDGQMNPKINALVESLSVFEEQAEKGVRVGLADHFNKVKNGVVELETDLRRYRKMIELRAKAGNLSGKLLVAFKGSSKMDFRKAIKYKPAVQKQLESIDRLLDLVGGVKQGKLTDEKILASIKRELSGADELSKTGDLKTVVQKEFDAVTDEGVDTIWGKYKQKISEQVLKTLRLSKATNKAALDMFSTSVAKNLKDAVAPNKQVAKKVGQTLDNLQDILANPEKYKESIDVLIKDITDAKNLDPDAASNAIRVLNDLKEGTQGKRFLEGLPQRDKLVQKVIKEEIGNITKKVKEAIKKGTEKQLVEDVISDISTRVTNLGFQEKQVLIDMVRAELGNTVTAMREKILGNFISKEIYQKYSLKHSIEELDDMADKSIAEIREYLGATAKKSQVVPDDIKRLKDQARASKKVLTDKLKQEEVAAYNEFVKEFLQSLSKMDSFGKEEMGNFELFLRAAEKFRLNSLLFSIRTWTVGLLSAGFNMGYQPFKQMIKKYSEIKELQKLGMPGYGPEVSAMKVALQELTATSEYINNWSDLINILKATWKQNGHGAFNAKAFRRHEEDLISQTDELGNIKEGPIKLNFKNREQLQKLVSKYGVDNERNKNLFRKWAEEIVEGEPTTTVGKLLDPLFSVSFRAMGMFDQPFVFLGTMRALRSDALQQGLLKGLEGEALEKFTKERMQEALKREGDVLTWAKNEEFDEISELGFSMVYQQEYADKVISKAARDFARWSRSGEDSYRNPLKIGARLFVPFIKTPTAIAQWTVDNMPVLSHLNWAKSLRGMSKTARELKKIEETIIANTDARKAKPITKDQIKEIDDAQEVLMQQRQELILKNAEEKAEATANGISSTVLGVGVTTAIASGNITGSGAHLSDDQKARLREAGWRPNTLYIGGYKIDYSRFEPFSTLVSVHADLIHYKMMSGEGLTNDDLEWYNVLRSSFVSNFSDKYFLRGLKSFFSLLDNRAGDYNAESVAVDFLSSLSPTLIRDLNQMNQEYQTKAHGFKDRLLERSFGKFPGLYARNLLGEKVERQWQMEGAWGVLSPVYFAKDERDTLMTEIAQIREDVGGRKSFKRSEEQTIDTRDYRDPKTGISLQDKWMDEMSSIKISGKTLRKTLEKLVKTKKYKEASSFEIVGADYTKASLIQEQLTKYRDKAWKEVRKDRKLRKYTDADGNTWIDVITGEVSLIDQPLGAVVGIADVSLPKQ
jgi:hypothetical protein